MRRLLAQALQADHFQVARDASIPLPRRDRLLVQHALDQPLPARVLERGLERQQLVERGPQRIEVAARVGMSLEPLRGHVPQRPHHVAGVRQILLVLRLREPEIGDPDVAAGIQEQVRRLDVSMQHARLVGIGQRLGHLHRDARDTPPVGLNP